MTDFPLILINRELERNVEQVSEAEAAPAESRKINVIFT